jgi:N-acetyl-gamma-glutamyl-phosphate reductase
VEKMIRAGIFGATGYTGYELSRLLLGHPKAEIVFGTSRSSAGLRLSDLYPCPYDVALVAPEHAELDQIDVAFFCLPHGESMSWVERACQAGVRVIDLSADFRLRDVGVYEQWYKVPHTSPDLLAKAVYGLPEVYRERIASADLVAGPGCYPTSVLLALYPLIRGDHLHSERIIVDSKSGVSGAGRKASVKSLFVEVNEDFKPYAVGRAHRHLPEIEQELQAWGGEVRVTFSPHLLPVSRGILSTMYVTLGPEWSVDRLVDLYKKAYANEPFIHILPEGQLSSLAFVANTNRCALSFAGAGESEFIIVSAIDNLLKGASGQLVQCMNLMFGLDEGMGLPG